MATAHPLEDGGSLTAASPGGGEAASGQKNDSAAKGPTESKKGDGEDDGIADRYQSHRQEAPKTGDTPVVGPDKNGRTVLTAEDVIGSASNDVSTGADARDSSKGEPGGASAKRKSKSKSKDKTGDKAKGGQEAPQPGLWEESSADAGGNESRPRANRSAVSAGARKTRDEVYRAMIELLPPKDDHLDALEKKGVMREAAAVGRFGSLDAGARGRSPRN